MIKYELICNDCEISFDSWFSSSKEYEKLKKKNLLSCYICNSLHVEKSLMSPNVFRLKNDTSIEKKNKEYVKIKKIIFEYQKFIKRNFNYVGENFAYEARAIHYKNKKAPKGIYGTVTKDDLKDLKEEGIDTETIPWIKDTTN
jgi:hypothetical protein